MKFGSGGRVNKSNGLRDIWGAARAWVSIAANHQHSGTLSQLEDESASARADAADWPAPTVSQSRDRGQLICGDLQRRWEQVCAARALQLAAAWRGWGLKTANVIGG